MENQRTRNFEGGWSVGILECWKTGVMFRLPTIPALQSSMLYLIDNPPLIPYISLAIYSGLSGRNSVVECQLPKLDVAGSTPVARSNP